MAYSLSPLTPPRGILTPFPGKPGRGYTSVEADGDTLVFTGTDDVVETVTIPALVEAVEDAAVGAMVADPGSDTRAAVDARITAVGNATYAPAFGTTGITYNGDGSVATVTENGVTTTYTYNGDGTVHTDTRLGVTRTYTYDGSGNLTGIAS